MVSEPKRLWKRYLLKDMPFVALVLAEMLKRAYTHLSSNTQFETPSGR